MKNGKRDGKGYPITDVLSGLLIDNESLWYFGDLTLYLPFSIGNMSSINSIIPIDTLKPSSEVYSQYCFSGEFNYR